MSLRWCVDGDELANGPALASAIGVGMRLGMRIESDWDTVQHEGVACVSASTCTGLLVYEAVNMPATAWDGCACEWTWTCECDLGEGGMRLRMRMSV